MRSLQLEGYQGSLGELVAGLKGRRVDPLGLSATELVRQCRVQWQAVASVDEVAEELPDTAWILRRKGQALFPEATEETPESPPGLRAPWLETAGVLLRDLWLQTPPGLGGPPRWPDPTPRPPRDATPWRLALAWPTGRPRRPPAVATVVVPTRTWWRRGMALLRRLRGRPDGIEWRELAAHWGRREGVEAFTVVMALWGRQHLSLQQERPFGPLRVQWVGLRRSRGRRTP